MLSWADRPLVAPHGIRPLMPLFLGRGLFVSILSLCPPLGICMKQDWSWKQPEDIKTSKWLKTKELKASKKKRKKKKKQRNQRVTKGNSDKFYRSPEWRKLRVRVLERYDCKCMMCGRSPKLHNVVLNVDHIKPRSKFPHLSLVFSNLQILCGACNHGKLNRYETDYRPDTPESLEEINDMLDMELLNNLPT